MIEKILTNCKISYKLINKDNRVKLIKVNSK